MAEAVDIRIVYVKSTGEVCNRRNELESSQLPSNLSALTSGHTAQLLVLPPTSRLTYES